MTNALILYEREKLFCGHQVNLKSPKLKTFIIYFVTAIRLLIIKLS